MSIQNNSVLSYGHLKKSGIMRGYRKKILEILKNFGPKTNLEVESISGIKINSVTGIMNSLVKDGYVEKKVDKTAATGRRNIVWGARSKQGQIQLF